MSNGPSRPADSPDRGDGFVRKGVRRNHHTITPPRRDRRVRVPFRRRQDMQISRLLARAVLGAVLLAAAPAFAQEKLTVFWVKGFYKSEDDALFEAIKKFEAKNGVKVELSQYAIQDMIPKTVSALDAGSVPDVAYADVYDFQVAGKWAFDGKLEDISDVLSPMKDRFAPNTLETTFLYN